MRHSILLVLLVFAHPGLAQEPALPHWLAGCWAAEGAETGSGEYWLEPAGDMMLGIGRTVREGRTVDHEFLSLHVDADGRLVYTARPARQAETAFVAVTVTPDSAVFENPDHDFPQRIDYRLLPDGQLQVRIDGNRDGDYRAVDFAFQRVDCAE